MSIKFYKKVKDNIDFFLLVKTIIFGLMELLASLLLATPRP
jgi:hypothetical protein